ncbi:hypothetical protein LIER_35246 [Lithospermum erythrorhizon]|uniref:Uncharacterized protein n=1 Tax=Lithospermum erythrorhizon TaxID=34254 RepID=A0AAV3NMB6_LITER
MSTNKGTQPKKMEGSKGSKGNMHEEADVLEEAVPLRRVSPEPEREDGPLLINAYRLPWYIDLEAFRSQTQDEVQHVENPCVEKQADKAKVEKSDKEKDIGKDRVEEEEVVAPSTEERDFNINMSPDLGGGGLADSENTALLCPR